MTYINVVTNIYMYMSVCVDVSGLTKSSTLLLGEARYRSFLYRVTTLFRIIRSNTCPQKLTWKIITIICICWFYDHNVIDFLIHQHFMTLCFLNGYYIYFM